MEGRKSQDQFQRLKTLQLIAIDIGRESGSLTLEASRDHAPHWKFLIPLLSTSTSPYVKNIRNLFWVLCYNCHKMKKYWKKHYLVTLSWNCQGLSCAVVGRRPEAAPWTRTSWSAPWTRGTGGCPAGSSSGSCRPPAWPPAAGLTRQESTSSLLNYIFSCE